MNLEIFYDSSSIAAQGKREQFLKEAEEYRLRGEIKYLPLIPVRAWRIVMERRVLFRSTPRQITKQDRIRQIPAFAKLNNRTINEIARFSEIVTVSAGQILGKEVEQGYELYIILNGQARVEKKGRTIDRLSKNDLCGELSIVDREPNIGTVISETRLLVLAVESPYFNYLLELAPGLWKMTSLALSKYVRSLYRILDDELRAEAEEGHHASQLLPMLVEQP